MRNVTESVLHARLAVATPTRERDGGVSRTNAVLGHCNTSALTGLFAVTQDRTPNSTIPARTP